MGNLTANSNDLIGLNKSSENHREKWQESQKNKQEDHINKIRQVKHKYIDNIEGIDTQKASKTKSSGAALRQYFRKKSDIQTNTTEISNEATENLNGDMCGFEPDYVDCWKDYGIENYINNIEFQDNTSHNQKNEKNIYKNSGSNIPSIGMTINNTKKSSIEGNTFVKFINEKNSMSGNLNQAGLYQPVTKKGLSKRYTRSEIIENKISPIKFDYDPWKKRQNHKKEH